MHCDVVICIYLYIDVYTTLAGAEAHETLQLILLDT